jgi:hypothetical protein
MGKKVSFIGGGLWEEQRKEPSEIEKSIPVICPVLVETF